MQVGQDRLAEDGVGGRGVLDQRPDMVLGRERDGDQALARFRAGLAQAVEGGLEVVGEGRHLGEPEHGARALDRVHGAEGAVDQLAVGRVGAEVEQGLLELVEQLGRLLAECRCGVDA